MMDDKLNCADVNEKVDDESVDKLQLHESNPRDLQAHIKADSISAGERYCE